MGRPPIQDETVVISANGQGAAWNPKVGFMGERNLITRAQTAALWGMVVTIHPLLDPVTAGNATPLGAYAALSWASGGRDLIVSAPQSLTELFDSLPEEGEAPEICPEGQIEFMPEDDLEVN